MALLQEKQRLNPNTVAGTQIAPAAHHKPEGGYMNYTESEFEDYLGPDIGTFFDGIFWEGVDLWLDFPNGEAL